jgi:hypothetical protein
MRARPSTGQRQCWGRARTRHPLTSEANAMSCTIAREREGSRAARPNTHAIAQGVNRSSAATGGSVYTPCVDRADQTCCAGYHER